MKTLFKNRTFKIILSLIICLVLGALISAANGHGETAQSTVVGTVFAPCHFVAQKISNGIGKISGNIKGDAEYEKEILRLKDEISELQSQLVDYQSLKDQNELYKEFLELKEENKGHLKWNCSR